MNIPHIEDGQYIIDDRGEKNLMAVDENEYQALYFVNAVTEQVFDHYGIEKGEQLIRSIFSDECFNDIIENTKKNYSSDKRVTEKKDKLDGDMISFLHSQGVIQ